MNQSKTWSACRMAGLAAGKEFVIAHQFGRLAALTQPADAEPHSQPPGRLRGAGERRPRWCGERCTGRGRACRPPRSRCARVRTWRGRRCASCTGADVRGRHAPRGRATSWVAGMMSVSSCLARADTRQRVALSARTAISSEVVVERGAVGAPVQSPADPFDLAGRQHPLQLAPGHAVLRGVGSGESLGECADVPELHHLEACLGTQRWLSLPDPLEVPGTGDM